MTSEGNRVELVLEDGSIFSGRGFGAEAQTGGEVVFNTGMVGYPESLTDPSYHGQILVMTYPLIGNYGVPGDEEEDGLSKFFESESIHVRGLVITDLSREYSHWNAKRSLHDWLAEQGIPGVEGVDTRALTRKLRHHGTMLGRLAPAGDAGGEKEAKGGEAGVGGKDVAGKEVAGKDVAGRDEAGKEVGRKPMLEDPYRMNVIPEVSVKEPVVYQRGGKKVVLVDCGVKHNIIKSFLRRDITVVRVPWNHDPATVEADGIVLSNGPGDPKMCPETIANVRRAMEGGTPILGICLGSQILGLAAGADTYKLKFGHRGQNQPCVEAGTRNRCYITSQNHGYAVDTDSLPQDWREWFYNNNDGTNEGIMHISKPFFGAQFHPEASPGPDDTEFIFDMFVRALER